MQHYRWLAVPLLVAMAGLLGGCDDIAKAKSDWADLKKRLSAVEQRLAALQGRVDELAAAKTAESSSYTGCIVSGMRGVRSNLAAQSVKEACMRRVEAPLPDGERAKSLAQAKAVYGPIYGGIGELPYGLHVTVNNPGPYTITELKISVTDKTAKSANEYVVNSFPQPVAQGVFVVGPPKDPTAIMTLPPGLHSFTVPIAERPTSPDFMEQYAWEITSAKGYEK